jgi:Mn-dependent DtxR family transcriptional regulator
MRPAGDINLFAKWSRGEELHLVSRRWDGVPHKVIARELKRTPQSVDQKVARLKERGL